MHSSHIQFFNFGDSQNLFGMMDRCETFTDCRTTMPLSFLKVSHLNTIPYGFYESPNEQNWMCELCTFSQIRSHMYNGKGQGSPPNCLLYVTNQIKLIYFNRTVSTSRPEPKCYLTCWHNFKNYKLLYSFLIFMHMYICIIVIFTIATTKYCRVTYF